MNGSKVLITGSSGFVGRYLSSKFYSKGYRLTCLVHALDPLRQAPVDQIPLDLTNKGEVFKVISAIGPDCVIHLAGNKSRDDSKSRFSYDANVSISLNVIEACLALPKLQKFVFLGSCDEYGLSDHAFDEKQQEMPVNNYGLAKLAITKLLYGLSKSCQFPSVVLRPTVIYGPNQGNEMFIPSLIGALLAGKDFPMTDGDQYRDFIYVDDVVEAINAAIQADQLPSGSVINIGSGHSCRVKDVALLLANLIDPNAIKHLRFGVVPYRPNEIMNYAANIGRAQKLLGWVPKTTLDDGLRRTLSGFRKSSDGQADDLFS